MTRTWRMVMALALWCAAMPAPMAQTGPAARAASSPATGQRISLDLKGVDILDVLKLLSQKSGLNFIAGKNVSGKVTIFANDVDVWEAFELIIGANDLAYERRGDIVTVMMARDYELLYGEKFQGRDQNIMVPLQYAKATQVATVLNQLKSSIGRVVADEGSNTVILNDVPSRLEDMKTLLKRLDRPSETRVYSLSYAEAEKLKEKVQGLLTPVGDYSFDARTNKVVITDLPEVLQKTDQIIQAFDVPDGEVLIDAKVIKVELTDEMDLGIDWQQLLSGIDLQGRSNFRVLGDIVGGTATGAALKLATAPEQTTQLVIEALKKMTKTETLSNPRIMVSNNQEAKILVGTKEAFVTTTTTVPATGAVVTSPEIQFVDVGTKLAVTPNIKRDGRVQLKIRPEVSTANVQTFENNRIPIVTTTEAETTVLVKSGVTLIIGGLIDTSNTATKSQMPGLGDIPLLGAAFKGTTNTRHKTELVVFLTPQIVLSDGAAFVPPEHAGPIERSDSELVPAGYRHAVRQRLQEQVTAQFHANQLPAGSVALVFVLNRDGHLAGAPQVASPQGEAFVTASTIALERAQPFAAFPEGTRAEEVRFRITVDYSP